MPGRVVGGGRYAHQAGDRQIQGLAAVAQEGVERVGVDAGLLRFTAGVDLNEQLGAGAAGLDGAGEAGGEAVAIEAVDRLEKVEGGVDLVGLKRADEVQ